MTEIDYTNRNVFIAGHKGMVGNAIFNLLQNSGYSNIITANRAELDLRNAENVTDFFENKKIEIVIDAAAKVGGILANDTFPYSFIMENMQIQNNLIDASVKNNISKFIFLGSSCIYPKFAQQPLKEEYLMSGFLEPTNEWYALAKISGIYACKAAKKQFGLNMVSLMPTNLYGQNDNFNLNTSHVLPAMIRKFHEAKETSSDVTLWGTGSPLREFLHVSDLAEAVSFSLEHNLTEDIYNVGFGSDISIYDLAQLVKKVVGFEGQIKWDKTKPDGTPKKLMDSSKIHTLGWKPKIDLEKGVKETYQWFLDNIEYIRS
jgi:GDP-L-fucose synthase